MFKIGDLVIYSGHGICRIDDICDKTFAGVTRTYYILHPIENSQKLTISTPVDNEKAPLLKLMNKEEALEILEMFKLDGIEWIDRPQQRAQVYSNTLNSGNRKEIAKVASTLLRKQIEVEEIGKKLYDNDNKLLMNIQGVLFKELSLALDKSMEEIENTIEKMIS